MIDLPRPKPGLVIRYQFLWSPEHDRGVTEGAKARPCAIIVAAKMDEGGEIRTVVAPVTHRPPAEPDRSVEIPASVCGQLGLDGGRHWIRIDELNRFSWPGFDLRPIPGSRGRVVYGMLPPRLFDRLRTAILSRQRTLAGRIIARD